MLQCEFQGGERMANIKSSKKRAQLAEERNKVNSQLKSAMRNQIKKCNTALEAKDDNKEAVLNKTISFIDKMAQKGIIHDKTAGRKVSRLQKKSNEIK